jgi:hypothetical protein
VANIKKAPARDDAGEVFFEGSVTVAANGVGELFDLEWEDAAHDAILTHGFETTTVGNDAYVVMTVNGSYITPDTGLPLRLWVHGDTIPENPNRFRARLHRGGRIVANIRNTTGSPITVTAYFRAQLVAAGTPIIPGAGA